MSAQLTGAADHLSILITRENPRTALEGRERDTGAVVSASEQEQGPAAGGQEPGSKAAGLIGEPERRPRFLGAEPSVGVGILAVKAGPGGRNDSWRGDGPCCVRAQDFKAKAQRQREEHAGYGTAAKATYTG